MTVISEAPNLTLEADKQFSQNPDLELRAKDLDGKFPQSQAVSQAQSLENQPHPPQAEPPDSNEEDQSKRYEDFVEIGKTVFIDGSAYSDPNLGKIIRAIESAGKDVVVFDFNGVIANQPDLTYGESLVMNPEAPQLIEKFIKEGYVPVLASRIDRESFLQFMREHPELQGLFKVVLTQNNFKEDFPEQRWEALSLAVQDDWLTLEEAKELSDRGDVKLIPALFPPSQTQGRKTLVVDDDPDNIILKKSPNYEFILINSYRGKEVSPGVGPQPKGGQFSKYWLKNVSGIEF